MEYFGPFFKCNFYEEEWRVEYYPKGKTNSVITSHEHDEFLEENGYEDVVLFKASETRTQEAANLLNKAFSEGVVDVV